MFENGKELSELYRDIILDHYKSPRGRHDVRDPDIVNEGHNPVCGDEIELRVRMDGDVIDDLGLHCAGCAISVASGSMLAEIAKGKTIEELRQIAAAVKALLTDGNVPEDIDLGELSDIEVLEGVRQFPVRIKCALLSWVTLIEGLDRYQNGSRESQPATTEA